MLMSATLGARRSRLAVELAHELGTLRQQLGVHHALDALLLDGWVALDGSSWLRMRGILVSVLPVPPSQVVRATCILALGALRCRRSS